MDIDYHLFLQKSIVFLFQYIDNSIIERHSYSYKVYHFSIIFSIIVRFKDLFDINRISVDGGGGNISGGEHKCKI